MTGAKTQYTVDDPEFWEGCYSQRMTPWDYGTHAPPLKTFLESPYKVPPGRLAVLGCGTGHDSLLFLQQGFEVTGVDFAPSAIQSTYQKFQASGLLGSKAYLLQRNIFDLFEYRGYFDYVLEHTCFCSIDPVNRRRYLFAVRDMLKPRGKLIGLWWVGERHGDGLPFSITKNELFDLFDDDFTFDIVYEPQDSFPQDQGKEVLTVMTKKV